MVKYLRRCFVEYNRLKFNPFRAIVVNGEFKSVLTSWTIVACSDCAVDILSDILIIAYHVIAGTFKSSNDEDSDSATDLSDINLSNVSFPVYNLTNILILEFISYYKSFKFYSGQSS